MTTDNPKFTAYLLGETEELTAAERAEIEALLASDSAAVQEAVELRGLSEQLRTELQAEIGAPLSKDQYANILKATDPKIIRFPRRVAVLTGTIAAGLLTIAVIGKLVVPSHLARVATRDGGIVALAEKPSASAAAKLSVAPQDPSPIQPPSSPVVASTRTPAQLATQPAPLMANTPRDTEKSNTDPGDLFVNAYMAVQQGEKAEQRGAFKQALEKLLMAVQVLDRISAQSPNWQTGVVDYRRRRTVDAITRVQNKIVRSGDGKLADNTPQSPLSIEPSSSSVAAPVQQPFALAPDKSAQASGEFLATRREASKPQSYGSVIVGKDGSITVPSVMLSASDDAAVVPLSVDTWEMKQKIRSAKAGDLQTMDRFPLSTYDVSGREEPTAESFGTFSDNGFQTVEKAPLSTFSADVDTASYAIVRRFLDRQSLPPKDAVRAEELLNYFSYDYPQPEAGQPFSSTMEVAACPWAPAHRLVQIGLRGREIAKDQRPPSNLVFLIDVSGSMMPANKLPLLKQSLNLLIDQLGEQDQVAIVVYAGKSGCVLEPTHDKAKMRAALSRLEAGGSTNGASGIHLAYQLAEDSYIKGGTNRVILATDGDWNVGVTNPADLFDLIARKARSNVFLTVLGVGMDNLQDSMLVKLADKGNGHYAYIDTLLEAKKVFVEQLTSTLITIAKDVKIQVEFNPAQVGAYRLIGYEKRVLAKEDFNDDQKDAGEIGAGHTVTALYEIVPAGQAFPENQKSVDPLKYQTHEAARPISQVKPVVVAPEYGSLSPEARRELLTLKLRYKEPEGDKSKLLEFPLTDAGRGWEKSSADFRFAAAVVSYGMLLRDSADKGQMTWNSTLELAREGLGEDRHGYRAEFISLVEKARALSR